MNSEEFDRQMDRFKIVVELGDFSNNHSGPQPVPPALLEKLASIHPLELANLITFGLIEALVLAEDLYIKGATTDARQNPPTPEVIKAVVIFDQIDAFIRALPCLEEIFNQFGYSIRDQITSAITLEKVYALTVRHLVVSYQLNGRIAKQALAQSERRTQTRIFLWIRDLLINYRPQPTV